MRDLDVIEHIRATFTPLILAKTVQKQERRHLRQVQRLSTWKPYQATSNDKRPAVQAQKTMFNLVPCANEFEQAFIDFLETAQDVAAFAKNAGPQKLMIDYLRPDGHRALYEPDFIVRLTDGKYYLVELKGRADELVPFKASAAMQWCKAATQSSPRWAYLYVPYHLFQQSAAATAQELARACEPSLKHLLDEAKTGQRELPLMETTAQKEAETVFARALQEAGIAEVNRLPSSEIEVMRQAISLLDYAVRANMPSYAHAFQPLLHPFDEYALHILERHLKPRIPENQRQRNAYFNPYLDSLKENQKRLLEKNGRYLKDNLLFGRSIMRLGPLLFCLYYAREGGWGASGMWKDVQEVFSAPAFAALYPELETVNAFRNTRIAHVETPLNDSSEAWAAMTSWLRCLNRMVTLM